MFQFEPCQFPRLSFLVRNCCCDPELIWLSMVVSAMNPPLDHPPSSSWIDPFTCARRNDVPWETAHTSVPLSMAWVGTTAKFSAVRQKLQVALPPIQSAFDLTAPVMVTSSGDWP